MSITEYLQGQISARPHRTGAASRKSLILMNSLGAKVLKLFQPLRSD